MHQLQRDIAKLLQVQEKERELLKLEAEKAALPAALGEAKARISEAEEAINALKAQIKELQVRKKDLELESEEKREAVAKYQKQQFEVKTNVEYQALQKEIVNRQVENSRIEDRILEVMLQVDEKETEIKARGESDKVLHAELAAQEKKAAEEGAKIDERIEVLKGERDALLPGIDDAILRKYQRIFKNKRDTAIVPLANYICGGCHMSLTPHAQHLAKKGDELVICESCSRILYWAEGLVEKESEAEKTGEEPSAKEPAEAEGASEPQHDGAPAAETERAVDSAETAAGPDAAEDVAQPEKASEISGAASTPGISVQQ